jgi:multimeric flavodoxin WrbA
MLLADRICPMNPPRLFQFVLTGARRDGNAELLARHAAKALPPGAVARWLDLAELPLPPFQDHRHEAGYVYGAVAGNQKVLFDATLAASDLVLVAPLYWYSLPSVAKLYLDYWSSWLRVPGADFRARMAGKRLWGVTVLSEEDPDRSEPLVGTLRLTADYLAMGWGGVLVGRGNRPGDVFGDTAALAAACRFFHGKNSNGDAIRV